MRVLILSASTGGGHKQASNALANMIREKDPNAQVRVEDAIEYCGRLFNKTVSGGYHYLATKAPHLYGTVYKISDKDTKLNSVVGIVNDQMSKKLYPLFTEFNPDIVVSCHPFVTEMVARLKDLNLVKVPFIAIITDFSPHRAYIREKVNAYIVASDEMIDTLTTEYGVDEDKIHSLGIPINPSFYQERDVAAIKEGLGFSDNIPTMLIMAGSFGVTDILKIYESIVQLENELQIIVITGKNKKLYDAFESLLSESEEEFYVEEDVSLLSDSAKRRLEKIKASIADKMENKVFRHIFKRSTNASKPTKLFYFVDNVGDYMAAADMIVTKPGGLTVSESIASALPMLIFDAIPGQEEYNAEYLVRNNMAVRLRKGAVADQVKELLENPGRLEEMRNNCKKYLKDRSAEHVYNLLKDMVKEEIESK